MHCYMFNTIMKNMWLFLKFGIFIITVISEYMACKYKQSRTKNLTNIKFCTHTAIMTSC